MVEQLRKNLESSFYSSLQVLKIPSVVFFVFGAGKARMPFTLSRSIRSPSLERSYVSWSRHGLEKNFQT